MKINQSSQIFDEAKKLLPGGVNSPVRAFGAVGTIPVFVDYAKDAYVYDVDGNQYIDYIGSWGPMILGHASNIATEGIDEAIARGTSYGLPTMIEVEVAQLIQEAYPSMEMVRFVNSGTEATMSALRVARGYTRRDKILKFEGCYHGHSDSLLVKAGSGALTYGVPTSLGVTEGTAKDTLVGRYNDIDNLREIIETNKNSLAAVILEPIPGNMGIVIPSLEFLREVRKLTKQYGIILIFDEVITGYRVDYGGAQRLYDIKPDMTCLGKIIGGGMPVGAYGGRRELMTLVAPLGGVYQAGTLSGNPIAMHMGRNVLRYLEAHQETYQYLDEIGGYMEAGMRKNIELTKIKASVNRVKGLLTLFFTEEHNRTYEDVMKSDTKMYQAYFNKMLKRGILLPPAQFEAIFLSKAHTKQDIDKTLAAQLSVFHEMAML